MTDTTADLVAALEEAERTFRWYGDLHAAKPDAEKAQRNYDLADRMAAVLARAKAGEDPDFTALQEPGHG